jgi:hypothetical protein
MEKKEDNQLNQNKLLAAMSFKYTDGTYVHRHLNELSAKLSLSEKWIKEELMTMIQSGIVEKIIVPSFRNHCFIESSTTNLNARKEDFDGLQDPDDFEELDPYDLELHEFYRRKA